MGGLKRLFSVLLALSLLLPAAGCRSRAAAGADLDSIFDDIQAAVMLPAMTACPPGQPEGLALPDDIEPLRSVMWQCVDGTDIRIIMMFELSDEKEAKKVCSALSKYVADCVKANQNVSEKNLKLLKNAVVRNLDSYVCCFIIDDSDMAFRIFRSGLQ